MRNQAQYLAWLATNPVIAGGATNEENYWGVSLTMPAPAAANNGVGPISNDPLMYGRGTSPAFGLAGVAETSYTPPGSAVATGNISFKTVGVFFLSVRGFNAASGGSGTAFKPGDKVYAGTDGTYDATTGCYYGFTLCADSAAGISFGVVLDPVTSGQTTTVRVRLKIGA